MDRGRAVRRQEGDQFGAALDALLLWAESAPGAVRERLIESHPEPI
ncbi:hypothetical protein [Phenylobacterium deserti]|nr:hypothetical protein [Phenylobacterium deserti]